MTDQQLVSAMEHPTRVHAIRILNERAASPSELARELGRPAKHVSYHLQRLEELGVIEFVGIRKVAGSRRTARYYRALARPWFNTERWRQTEPDHQPSVTSNILALCNRDLAAAVTSGTIHGKDNHISRTPMLLDRPGYEELIARLERCLEELIALQQEAAARMKQGDETVLTKVHIIQFESPDTTP